MKKRIFSMALALVLTMALAAPAFAAGEEEAPAPEYRLVSITGSLEPYTFTYDQGGWLPTAAEDARDGEARVTASYDDAGRVVSLEDFSRGAVYTHEYNENGDVLASGTHINEMYSADGTTTTWDMNITHTYDENGNRTSSKSTRVSGGETIVWEDEYTNDDAGNTLSCKSYTNGELTSQYQNTYDDAGNLLRKETTSSDGTVSTTEYTYDEAGNLLREETFEDGVTDYAYEYTYDEAGNKLSETYYSDGEKYDETTYVYDDEGRVAQENYVSSARSRSTKYIYTPLLTFTLEESSDSENYVSYYLYDREGVQILQSGTSYTSEPQFTYDDNGYVTQIDFSWNENDESFVFTYEPVS